MKKFEIEILNYFDRDEIVAEIYYNHVQWAEISLLNKEVSVQFYSHPSDKCWIFSYEQAIKSLEQAKNKLLSKSNKKSSFFLVPRQINEQAQEVLEEILNHPEKIVHERPHPDFGKVIEVVVPGKGGARFTSDGEMIGFLEP